MSTSPVSRVVANLSGIEGIIKKIRNRVGTENPVYLSIDIDTLDPACEYTPSPITAIVTQTDATSRPRHRDPGNRRLDHSRTAHDCSRVGWIESHRGGYRRGISCVWYKCRAVNYVCVLTWVIGERNANGYGWLGLRRIRCMRSWLSWLRRGPYLFLNQVNCEHD